MTIDQEVVYSETSQLKLNPFTNPRGAEVEFAGWAASREDAASCRSLSAAGQTVAFSSLKKCGITDLYAAWRSREVVAEYSDFSISGEDADWSATSARVAWTVRQRLRYAGSSSYFSDKTLSSFGYSEWSSPFSPNGTAGSGRPTSARTVAVSLDMQPFGHAACYVKQGGYTPSYAIATDRQVSDPTMYLSTEPSSSGQKTHSFEDVNVWSSRDGVFKLSSQPRVWTAKRGCAEYKKPPSEWLNHTYNHVKANGKKVTAYNDCGYWSDALSGWIGSDGTFVEAADGVATLTAQDGAIVSYAPVYVEQPMHRGNQKNSRTRSVFGSDDVARKACEKPLTATSFDAKPDTPVDGTAVVSGQIWLDLKNSTVFSADREETASLAVQYCADGAIKATCEKTFTFTSGNLRQDFKFEISGVTRGSNHYLKFCQPAQSGKKKSDVRLHALIDYVAIKRASVSEETASAPAVYTRDSVPQSVQDMLSSSSSAATHVQAASSPAIDKSSPQTYVGSGLIECASKAKTGFDIAGKRCVAKFTVRGGRVRDAKAEYASAIDAVSVSLRHQLGLDTATTFDVYRRPGKTFTDLPPATDYEFYVYIPRNLFGRCECEVDWTAAHAQRNSSDAVWRSPESVSVDATLFTF